MRILTNLIRTKLDWPEQLELPGENHQYLTEFGESQLYTHEHRRLDKLKIVEEIPEAVTELMNLVAATETRHRPHQ